MNQCASFKLHTCQKGGGIDHLDGGGEHREAPGRREGERGQQQAGAATKLEDLTRQQSAKQGAQQRQAGNPGALLGRDVKIRGRVGGGVGGDSLEGGQSRGGVALGQAD